MTASHEHAVRMIRCDTDHDGLSGVTLRLDGDVQAIFSVSVEDALS